MSVDAAFRRVGEAERLERRRYGKEAEALAARALENLTQREESGIATSWHGSNDDDRRRGIDFYALVAETGEVVPLQIKGFPAGVERAKEEHPDVPCVALPPGTDVNQAAELIRKTILGLPLEE